MAYVPVFVLIQLFTRTSSRESKWNRLEKVFQDSSESSKPPSVKISPSNKSSPKKKPLTFSWRFKIILYSFSIGLMVVSVCFVTVKGKLLMKSSSERI